MDDDLRLAIRTLIDEGAGCVLARSGQILAIGRGRGLLPLLEVLEETRDATGASLADIIVGRAAAMLAQSAGVRAVHGEVMSAGAARELERRGQHFSYGRLVDHIIARTGTGECPFERLVAGCSEPEEVRARAREVAEQGLESTLARYGLTL